MKNKTTVITYAVIAGACFIFAMNRYNSVDSSMLRMMGRIDGIYLMAISYVIIFGVLSITTSVSNDPLAKLNLGGKILFGALLLVIPYVAFLPWVIPFTKNRALK